MQMDCGEHTNYFDQLPDEMIIKIFSNLHQTDLINVAEVCERFENVVNDGSFWKSVSLNALHLKQDDFDHIIKFPIKELEITNCDISPVHEKRNGKSRKKLDKLVLSKLNNKTCQYVTKKCNPKHLIINDVCMILHKLEYDALTDLKSKTILEARLEVISMWRVNLIEYHDFRAVVDVDLCKNLKEIDLGRSIIKTEAFQGILECLPESVERLMFGSVCLVKNDPRVYKGVYRGGRYHVPTVIFINAARYMETIVRRLPNLKLLGAHATNFGRQEYIAWMAELQFLNTLRFSSYESFQFIIENLFNILTHLRQVRTIQFVMKKDVSEKSKQELEIELNKSRRQLTKDYHIDFEVQYLHPEVHTKKPQ